MGSDRSGAPAAPTPAQIAAAAGAAAGAASGAASGAAPGGGPSGSVQSQPAQPQPDQGQTSQNQSASVASQALPELILGKHPRSESPSPNANGSDKGMSNNDTSAMTDGPSDGANKRVQLSVPANGTSPTSSATAAAVAAAAAAAVANMPSNTGAGMRPPAPPAGGSTSSSSAPATNSSGSSVANSTNANGAGAATSTQPTSGTPTTASSSNAHSASQSGQQAPPKIPQSALYLSQNLPLHALHTQAITQPGQAQNQVQHDASKLIAQAIGAPAALQHGLAPLSAANAILANSASASTTTPVAHEPDLDDVLLQTAESSGVSLSTDIRILMMYAKTMIAKQKRDLDVVRVEYERHATMQMTKLDLIAKHVQSNPSVPRVTTSPGVAPGVPAVPGVHTVSAVPPPVSVPSVGNEASSVDEATAAAAVAASAAAAAAAVSLAAESASRAAPADQNTSSAGHP